MSGAIGLLPAFQAVRVRIPRLGVTEYLALLHALEAGFGTGSRGELVELCQMLWAKSPREQRQVADALEVFLPERLGEEELERLWAHDPAVSPTEPASSAAPGPAAPPRSPAAPPPAEGGRGETLAGPAVGTVEVGMGKLPDAPPPGVALGLRFDLEGVLPVTHRQMSRAWRFFRRMGRRGVAVEVDAEATVRRLYEDGVLVEPVLVPRRTNQARALILEDAGGSMVPFRYATAALMEAARHAGLARVEVRYFHDVPVDVVFRDPALLEPVRLDDALAHYTDAGVLVYSDGGAARGGRDEMRVKRTVRLVEALRRCTPTVAWLNPVPRERWAGTTAGDIRDRCRIPMFPFDREGVQGAVDELRGRVR